MNISGKDNLWIGLFTHLDSVTRATLELLLQLKGMGFTEHGKEYFVPESKFKTLNKLVKNREVRVGGNAGNAAYFLGKIGIDCVLSSPKRPPELMTFFETLPVYFYGVRKKTAETARRKDDPSYEHLIIELFKPLSNECRTIISWDPVTRNGLLDSGFWEKIGGKPLTAQRSSRKIGSALITLLGLARTHITTIIYNDSFFIVFKFF